MRPPAPGTSGCRLPEVQDDGDRRSRPPKVDARAAASPRTSTRPLGSRKGRQQRPNHPSEEEATTLGVLLAIPTQRACHSRLVARGAVPSPTGGRAAFS